MAIPCHRDIEEHEAPAPIPIAGPTSLRVTPAQRLETTLPGQTVDAVFRSSGVAFEQALLLQHCELAHKTLAVRPAFEGLGQVPKRRPRQALGGPKEEVE